MKRFCSAVALAVVGVLTLAGPAAAADPVPFRGSLDGDVTHAPVDARTDAVLVEAAGTATQLGQFEVSVPHLVDLPTAVALVLSLCAGFREPETTRRAHRLVNARRRDARLGNAP